MTVNEIVRSYNEAANKSKQIGILADLTQRTTSDIVRLLEENGAQLPEKPVKAEMSKCEYMKPSKWTNEKEARLLALKEKGLTWAQIAEEIGGTAKSVSMHYYGMIKPKHVSCDMKAAKEASPPVEESKAKTSAFGFDNIIAVLTAGEFNTVTFENAEVSVTVRRKAV